MTTTSHPDAGARQDGMASSSGSLSLLTSRLGSAAFKELSLPLCTTCSTQTSYQGPDLDLQSDDSEYKCRVCLDPRQYIGISGQKWTTLGTLPGSQDRPLSNDFTEVIPGSLWTFKTRPSFGIGQRAFLIKDEAVDGLVMWDCVAYLDDDTLKTIDAISDGKGLSHMVISHPHFYSTIATWIAAFPSATLWLAKEDCDEWFQRADVLQERATNEGIGSRISLLHEEQTAIDPSAHIKVLLLGGHFPGSLVLLWNDILFVADTVQVVPSGRYKSDQPQRSSVTSVSFMWR